MSDFFKYRQSKGSILIEVIISVVIFILGLTGAFSILSSVGNANQIHKNHLIASNLAQEALEAIRSIRDTNWMTYSSSLRECWNFAEDIDENGIMSDEESCIPDNNGQNQHPFDNQGGKKFIVDFDHATFRWNLIREDRFSILDESPYDYSQGFHLYTDTINGKEFYTHNRPNANAVPTLFSREVEMYYVDADDFIDKGNGTFEGGGFPSEEPAKDNRILVVVRVTWNQNAGGRQSMVLSTLLTDFLKRTEWES